jgi:hypothetical protein
LGPLPLGVTVIFYCDSGVFGVLGVLGVDLSDFFFFGGFFLAAGVFSLGFLLLLEFGLESGENNELVGVFSAPFLFGYSIL